MADTNQTSDSDMNGSARSKAGARVGEVAGGMVGVMENARSVAQDLASQLPSAAGATRQAMDQASRQMQTSSDEMLMVGSALAFGITVGLFLSGSNRFLVTLALVPAAAMGATLLDRRSRQGEL